MIKHSFEWFFAVLLIFSLHCKGQQYYSYDPVKFNKDYLLSIAGDVAATATSPVRWKKNQWIGATAVGGVTLFLITRDKNIRNFCQRNVSEAGHKLSMYVFDPMPTYYFGAFTGGMYLFGVLTRDSKTETAALLAGKTALISAGYATFFKGVFQRYRPNEGSFPDPEAWEGPFGDFSHGSFPSRHAAISFSAATVLADFYSEKRWVAIVAYSLASMITLSQLHEDQHWASDALAGAALGFAIGKLVSKRNITIHIY